MFKGINPATADRAFEMLFDAVAPGTSLLVDNSKKLQWAERFLDHPGFNKRFVHLVRDPRALVRRWDLTITDPREVRKRRWHVMRANPPRAFHALFAPKRKLWLYKWLAQNRGITQFLRSRSLDHKVVTYCDLARDPDGELRRLMDWIGLPYEPTQTEYWNFDHHGSQKVDYEWVKSEKRRFVDARWKEYLTPAEQESFGTDPDVLAISRKSAWRSRPTGSRGGSDVRGAEHLASHAAKPGLTQVWGRCGPRRRAPPARISRRGLRRLPPAQQVGWGRLHGQSACEPSARPDCAPSTPAPAGG